MKRLLVLLAVVLMLSTAVSASAEGVSMDLFSLIRGQLFEFSSGVGAWSTELTMLEDGTFWGNFHDSEMGETGEGYPNGTYSGDNAMTRYEYAQAEYNNKLQKQETVKGMLRQEAPELLKPDHPVIPKVDVLAPVKPMQPDLLETAQKRDIVTEDVIIPDMTVAEAEQILAETNMTEEEADRILAGIQ